MGIRDIPFMVKSTDPVHLAGIEHVGVGSDAGTESNDPGPAALLNSMLTKPDTRYKLHGGHQIVEGMWGPTRMYELTALLLRRGYTDEQIRLVIGGDLFL